MRSLYFRFSAVCGIISLSSIVLFHHSVETKGDRVAALLSEGGLLIAAVLLVAGLLSKGRQDQ